VNNYCDVIKSFLVLLLELLTAIGIFVFLFIWQPYGTLIVCLLTGGSVLLYARGTKKLVYNWGLVRQEQEGYVNQHLMQGLGGIKEVKLMGKEDFFLAEFSGHSTKKNRIIAKQLALIQVPRLFLEFLSVLGIVCLVFISVYRHVNIEYLLTILGVYMVGSYRLIPSVNKIMASLQNIKFHQPVVNLVATELERFKGLEKIAQLATGNKKIHLPFNHLVSVENLSFHYASNNRLVLKDISFQINKGECIGIIGESGSGKSTMIDLILGLMQPVKGKIFCDGKDIQENMRNWQNLIGYVPQNIYLTDSSLKANIAFGVPADEIDENALEDAISCAMLDTFVKNLEHGVNTQIGERGTKISGGQRQRIGIARALYHNPELLILDEATSALDSETEYDVMKAVTDLKGTRTIIIVAHRHSTLAKCDRIYEFGNGKIIRTVTPIELNIAL
jgi:ABC-type bacteriocin/lantibiotic exporter with double-glycine peptidase domain